MHLPIYSGPNATGWMSNEKMGKNRIEWISIFVAQNFSVWWWCFHESFQQHPNRICSSSHLMGTKKNKIINYFSLTIATETHNFIDAKHFFNFTANDRTNVNASQQFCSSNDDDIENTLCTNTNASQKRKKNKNDEANEINTERNECCCACAEYIGILVDFRVTNRETNNNTYKSN